MTTRCTSPSLMPTRCLSPSVFSEFLTSLQHSYPYSTWDTSTGPLSKKLRRWGKASTGEWAGAYGEEVWGGVRVRSGCGIPNRHLKRKRVNIPSLRLPPLRSPACNVGPGRHLCILISGGFPPFLDKNGSLCLNYLIITSFPSKRLAFCMW